MESCQPLVSIITPVLNRVAELGEMITSVLTQEYAAWELVVVDDGSDSATITLLEKFAKLDARVKWLRRVNTPTGACQCRNEGVARSQGKYVIFLDSDDLLDSACLAQRVQALEREPLFDAVVCQAQLFVHRLTDQPYCANNIEIGNDLFHFLIKNNVWLTPSVMWKRSVLDSMGWWDTDLSCWQDWEFHVRALFKGVTFLKYPRVDCHVRMGHSQRVSISQTQQSSAYIGECLNAIKKVYTLHFQSKSVDYRYLNALRYGTVNTLFKLCEINDRRLFLTKACEMRCAGILRTRDVAKCGFIALLSSLALRIRRMEAFWLACGFRDADEAMRNSRRNRWPVSSSCESGDR